MIRDRYTKNAIGLLLLLITQIPVHAESKSRPRITRQQLRQMAFDIPAGKTASRVNVRVGARKLRASHSMKQNRIIITLGKTVTIATDQEITVEISW